MKKCSKCLIEKPVEEFARQSRSKDGRALWCKECANDYMKVYNKVRWEKRDLSKEDARREAKREFVKSTVELIKSPDRKTKKCSKCDQIKLIEEFHKRRDERDGLSSWCKSCVNERYDTKHQRKRAKTVARERKYGLSEIEFIVKRELQDNRCALCNEPFGEETPAVDHDHSTGKIRGLLHRNCNVLLGMAGDSINKLQQAKEYLVRYSTPTIPVYEFGLGEGVIL